MAQLVAKDIDGFIVLWGFAPFWFGDDIAGLETLGPAPGGATNFENRLGVYVIQDPAGQQPVAVPWKGNLYVLNGNAPGDQPNNIVFVKVVNTCA
jgi:hypothetical protein